MSCMFSQIISYRIFQLLICEKITLLKVSVKDFAKVRNVQKVKDSSSLLKTLMNLIDLSHQYCVKILLKIVCLQHYSCLIYFNNLTYLEKCQWLDIKTNKNLVTAISYKKHLRGSAQNFHLFYLLFLFYKQITLSLQKCTSTHPSSSTSSFLSFIFFFSHFLFPSPTLTFSSSEVLSQSIILCASSTAYPSWLGLSLQSLLKTLEEDIENDVLAFAVLVLLLSFRH